MKIYLTIFIVVFMTLGCLSTKYQVEHKKGTQQVEFDGTITPAIQFQTDENHYLLDGHVQNQGTKNIYFIEAVIYLTNDGKKIQEKGPIILYEKETPLKPGYEASFNKILELPLSRWNGKTFILEITKTDTEPPKKTEKPEQNQK